MSAPIARRRPGAMGAGRTVRSCLHPSLSVAGRSPGPRPSATTTLTDAPFNAARDHHPHQRNARAGPGPRHRPGDDGQWQFGNHQQHDASDEEDRGEHVDDDRHLKHCGCRRSGSSGASDGPAEAQCRRGRGRGPSGRRLDHLERRMTFVAFTRNAPRTATEYARWRLAGISAGWLFRAGYASGSVRARRGALP
jgi:hypothetical protein